MQTPRNWKDKIKDGGQSAIDNVTIIREDQRDLESKWNEVMAKILQGR